MELSSRPIAVHLYHDLSRRSFRIIAVEGSKPILNKVLMDSISLHKASAKFLQWKDKSDPDGRTYGFGFANEGSLDRFADAVARILALIVDGPPLNPPTADSPPANRPSSGPADYLKLENARLKAALCESSVNAKKWETELGDLKAANEALRRELALRDAGGNTEVLHSSSVSRLCPTLSK